MLVLLDELSNRISLISLFCVLFFGGLASFIKRREYLFLRVVDMDNGVLMKLIADFLRQGISKFHPAHNLIEDAVNMFFLHNWQQLDLNRIMHVTDYHLPRNDLIVLAYVLISYDDLLN